MADESAEKEFDPTPQKLMEARRKGDIAKSTDLNTAAAYLGFLIALFFVFEGAVRNLGDIFLVATELSANAGQLRNSSDNIAILQTVITEVGVAWLPMFVVPIGFVLLSISAQRSLTFAPTKIQPKLNRISLISGIKNKFGRAGLFEFLKSFAKLAIFMAVLAVFVVTNFDQIAMAAQVSPGAAMLSLGSLMYGLLFIIVALTFAIGGLDFTFQFAEHRRKNRMSRKDLQDEIKSAEGDPHFKQRRRQKALALASGQMADVPNASVVMVNPTHYAVALTWDPMAASAPIVVAKGADEVAHRIREIAHANDVPIHSDPPGTRALFAVAEIGSPVPRDQYEAVAAAIRFADSIRQKRAASYG